jgi:phosphatidylserine/phosphatidylglycerophosphate/cardiolipin synthase-like enzyme
MKKKIIIKTLIIMFLGIPLVCLTKPFAPNASYTVCFTPGENCTQEIVNTIDKAQKTILVQAYQFTSSPIEKAVINAKQRGVDVKIILDKSQYKQNKFCSSQFFSDYGIPVWIDSKPSIAHNKVFIIDNKEVITGSFNFSKNAQEHNAENLLIINDSILAKMYAQNWHQRLEASVSLDEYSKKYD